MYGSALFVCLLMCIIGGWMIRKGWKGKDDHGIIGGFLLIFLAILFALAVESQYH